MRTRIILVFALLLAARADSQAAPKLPTEAECKFPDGTTIKVSYSSEHHSYLFRTDGGLVTIRGVRVLSGDYAVSLARDQDRHWTLRMRRQILKTGDSMVPPLPMSVVTKAVPAGNLPVVFDQAGESCMMYWRQNGLLLSLEFTRENSDMPVSSGAVR